MRFKKIAIIGVGLIGGSVGLAVKKRRLARQVTGVFRHLTTMRRALRRKAVDAGFMDMAGGVKDADLIIIGSPVFSIPRLAADAAKHAKRGAIITDVGSTKAYIVDKMERSLKNSKAVFIGSHPMAGSEKAGVEAARADLFESSPCIVTRTARSDLKALAAVAAFWKSVGARVKILTPSEHDRAVALVSHLPHIVAFSLAGSVPAGALEFAAEGFKDTTRVASSDPDLWSDIFLTNRKEILMSAGLFRKYYNGILSAISKGDRRRTVRELKKAGLNRAIFLKQAHANKKN